MAARKRSAKSLVGGVAAAGSWTALLAATALGIQGASSVRAEVKADGLRDAESYRLIVQSYDASEPEFSRARPLGATQRVVTGAELRRGVSLNLVEIRSGGAANAQLVAWIDGGTPDLEFEGLAARPAVGSVYGSAERSAGDVAVKIRLDRQLG